MENKFGGLLTRRPRWGVSWRGWLVLSIIAGLGSVGFAVWAHPFFALTEKKETRILAVEGWVHEYAINVAFDEFERGSYERVFSTGGPLNGMLGYVGDHTTAAGVGATRLKAAGIPAALVQSVPSGPHDRDRTYSAAVALREWLRANRMTPKAINVLTLDVHARRTRLLFQKAFGDTVVIGIISVPNPDYDAARWWRYSQGVRSVFGECIAYIYAKFFFFPAGGSVAERLPAPGSETLTERHAKVAFPLESTSAAQK